METTDYDLLSLLTSYLTRISLTKENFENAVSIIAKINEAGYLSELYDPYSRRS